MLVYLDNDVYGHLESAGDKHSRITAADRDFLYSCAAARRISVYFSAINCLELSNMLSGNVGKLQRVAQVARRLCPVRHLSKTTSEIVADDITFWQEHGWARRVDVRAPAARRRGLKGEDWISLLTSVGIPEARNKSPHLAQIVEQQARSSVLCQQLQRSQEELRCSTERPTSIHELQQAHFTTHRKHVVKFLWLESGLEGLEELEKGVQDLPLEDMQSFRVFTEYLAALIFECSVHSLKVGTGGRPRKINDNDFPDMEHAIFSGFADVFVSDDGGARARYAHLTDPVPDAQPKPKCVDLREFVDMVRQV